uniref:Peroxisomal-coenzyme a synthetase n=1 Tax=Nannochloropsis gaditana (strain CCMP526) TaxID=1093141 RepID=I2CS66_NANGC
MYMHTSGTTSRPKRVRLTHGNLVASLANIQATYELSPADRTLLVMPLFHVHGLIAGLLTSLASGGTVILHGRFAASTFWKHVSTHGATWYTAVPTMQQVLLMRAETDFPKDNPPPLRFIRSCSASLAASVLERLEKAFHAPVLEAYAMTENAHQMTSNPLPKHGPRKPGSVGKATGTVKVAILDDNCQPVPTGKVGEVCIQGPSVTPGYVNNEEANRVGFMGGWFHTGDQGFLDEEDYLTLTGRIKELINRGGEKISPLEVDAVLLSHPLVGEAVSFAAPDEKYGEEVHAVVTLKPGSSLSEEAIVQHCRLSLADFKLPKKVYIAQTVPRTATGKIQRRIVAEHFLKG